MLTLLLGCFPEIAPPADLPDNPYVDYDGDGYSMSELDCDDEDAEIWPGAVEACDGEDDDCDAIIDEGCDTAAPDDTATNQMSRQGQPSPGDGPADGLRERLNADPDRLSSPGR